MRQYDHHDPDCNVETWAEEAQGEAEFYGDQVTEEALLRSIE